jgi:hypothetical protein
MPGGHTAANKGSRRNDVAAVPHPEFGFGSARISRESRFGPEAPVVRSRTRFAPRSSETLT